MESTIYLDILGLFAIGLLVLANGFFVAAEFSLVSVRRTRVAELVEQGVHSADAVQKAIKNPDRIIAATQLGITLASLGLGWIGEPALAHLIEPLIQLLPPDIRSLVSQSLSVIIAFSIITFLHVVVGELAPKSIALQDPESTSLMIARPTLWTARIFKPAIWLLNGAGNALLKLVGVEPASGHQLVHSIHELKMLVTASTKGGVFQEDEGDMLHAVFNFGELIVRQVMIPRTEVIAVEADTRLPEIISLVTHSTFTKFPVYEDDLDNIVGVAHVKDLLAAMQKPDSQNFVAREFAREPIYIPETSSVRELLSRFRDDRQHIAIVIDEYGGTAGLATLEDLLEEIVGEVSDPYDEFVPELQALADGSLLVDGLTLIEVVNEQLGLNLKDPSYDTIAGYVLGKLGKIPHLHDTVESEDMQFRVEELDGLRISRIRMSRVH